MKPVEASSRVVEGLILSLSKDEAKISCFFSSLPGSEEPSPLAERCGPLGLPT